MSSPSLWKELQNWQIPSPEHSATLFGSLAEDDFLTSYEALLSMWPDESSQQTAAMSAPDQSGRSCDHAGHLSTAGEAIEGIPRLANSADQCQPDQEDTADHTQRLSQLNLVLLKQLRRVTSRPWDITLVNMVCQDMADQSTESNPLGDILRSSSEFLKVLHSLMPNQIDSQTSSQLLDSDRDTNPVRDNAHSSVRAVSAFSIVGFGAVEPLRIRSTSSPPIDTPVSNTNPSSRSVSSILAGRFACKTDIPGLLLIITYYMRIIHI